ncbi:hypothetical protein DDQ50_00075 [Amnibacterium flavum]|uniref:Uncharacterized protein n=1 Tax=Amnibacterium flavum TaxID=2173173 RepID=A0A2V1HXE3_9MICO|nr:hypothetical protein DDQ50_00075 [Amnibacterium flavum]
MAVWIVAAIAAVAVLILADPADRLIALSLTLAGSILLSFVLQLSLSEKTGFVSRLTSSTLGAFLVLVIASLVALALP